MKRPRAVNAPHLLRKVCTASVNKDTSDQAVPVRFVLCCDITCNLVYVFILVLHIVSWLMFVVPLLRLYEMNLDGITLQATLNTALVCVQTAPAVTIL